MLEYEIKAMGKCKPIFHFGGGDLISHAIKIFSLAIVLLDLCVKVVLYSYSDTSFRLSLCNFLPMNATDRAEYITLPITRP